MGKISNVKHFIMLLCLYFDAKNRESYCRIAFSSHTLTTVWRRIAESIRCLYFSKLPNHYQPFCILFFVNKSKNTSVLISIVVSALKSLTISYYLCRQSGGGEGEVSAAAAKVSPVITRAGCRVRGVASRAPNKPSRKFHNHGEGPY